MVPKMFEPLKFDCSLVELVEFIAVLKLSDDILQTLSASNNDGSFTRAISSSFLSHLEKIP